MSGFGSGVTAAICSPRVVTMNVSPAWARRSRIKGLRRSGVPLKDLGQAVGLSESQISRIATQPESALPAATAMELVHMAQRGEIDHEGFVEWLKVWPYEPQDKPATILDDTVFRSNSGDAAKHASFVQTLGVICDRQAVIMAGPPGADKGHARTERVPTDRA
ncbi:MAG: hypothetical protein FWF75_03285 [Propionibacteriaceae bacterium]|nr:hypothetical protein [Propionibacteriaceae bacterium]